MIERLRTLDSALEDVQVTLATNLTAKGKESSPTETLSILSNRVGDIEIGGGGTGEWQPDPEWWDIKNIIENDPDVANYAAVRILLLNANEVSKTTGSMFPQSSSYPAMVKTSDGSTYTTSATHIWDKTKDKQHSAGYATRYYIEYFGLSNITTMVDTNTIYFIYAKGNMNHSISSSHRMLKSFDFIGDSNFVGTTLASFAYTSPNFVRIPPNMNTSQVTTFYNFGYDSGIKELPNNFDTSSSTNFQYFLGNSPISTFPTLDTSKGTVLTSFLMSSYPLTLNLTQVNVALGISHLTSLSGAVLENWGRNILPPNTAPVTITMGATLLGRLSDEGKAFFTSKGYTLA